MKLLEFVPENDLEELVIRARRGSMSLDDLLSKVTDASVYLPSRKEVDQDGQGFEPLLIGTEAHPLVAAFSSLSRSETTRHRASYVLRMPGREFFQRLPGGFGVVLNPGFETQLVISEDVVVRLK